VTQIFNVDPKEFDKLRAVKSRGPNGQYPFDLIDVGQGFHCPLKQYEEQRGCKRTMRQFYSALYGSAYRRKPKEFTIFQDGAGYTVVRLS
jgi:hypothetical protein